MRCPARARVACSGALSLTVQVRGRPVAGLSAPFTLAPGAVRGVGIVPSHALAKALRSRSVLLARARARTTTSGGGRSTLSARDVVVHRSSRVPGLRAYGAATALVGNGGSLVAYTPSPGTTRLIEGATGESIDLATPPTCTLAAVGAGHVLYGCPPDDLDPGSFAFPLVFDTATSMWSLPAAPHDPSVDGRLFHSIGTWWIGAGVSGYHFSDFPDYLPYRAGAKASPPEPGKSVTDPNLRTLNRTLCEPLGLPTRGLLLYDPPYAVTFRAKAGVPLTLERCGHQTTRALSLCPAICTSVQARNGIVTWIERGHVLAASGAHPTRLHHLGLPAHTTALKVVHSATTAYALARRTGVGTRLYAIPIRP